LSASGCGFDHRGYSRNVERFERSGLTFDVRDGGPEQGEPVVLLHGFPQDSTSWRLVEPLLHANGLRTLAPDQRGYSPGARPPGRGHYRSSELALDVLGLLDAAGLESAHVVGHDWGGGVAWLLASQYPERVRSLTVLSTPHPRALMRSMYRSAQGLKSSYMLFFQVPVVPEAMLRPRMRDLLLRSGLPEEFAEHNDRRMREPGALSGALNWYRALPWALGSPPARCRVPTTYVWGAQDAFLGRTAAELTAAEVTASYRFEELPKAGHWLPETHPTELAALITDRVTSG
jgi:pimeloyl-ACP methyl ester carboxylesterase